MRFITNCDRGMELTKAKRFIRLFVENFTAIERLERAYVENKPLSVLQKASLESIICGKRGLKNAGFFGIKDMSNSEMGQRQMLHNFFKNWFLSKRYQNVLREANLEERIFIPA